MKNFNDSKIMIEIEADSIELALIEASRKLDCAIQDINYHTVRNPKKGVFGIGKRKAIIVANCKNNSQESKLVFDSNKQQKIEEEKKDSENSQITKLLNKKDEILKNISKKTDGIEQHFEAKAVVKNGNYSYDQRQDILVEVEEKITELFGFTCFEIKKPEVNFLNEENTIFIFFDGADAPLMIGREGYRYKAVSYMLSSWLYYSYGLKLKLEVGEFLQNQEELLKRYFEDEIYFEVEQNGSARTKVLDENLIKIALKILREKYPDKYVATRDTSKKESFITIDNFFSKNLK